MVNSVEAFAAMAAIQCIGARYSALHPLGSVDDHLYILDDAGIDALVVEPKVFAERLETLSGATRLLTLGATGHGEDILALVDAAEAGPLDVSRDCDATLATVYTGGTTGRPKGVEHRHRSFVTSALIVEAEYEWPSDIRMLIQTPISHAAGLMILPTLLRGGTMVLCKGFSVKGFHQAVTDGINSTFLVPTMIYAIMDHPGTRDVDFSRLELVIYGAAPMSPARIEEVIDIFGPVFMQAYAQSEVPLSVTILKKVDHDPARPGLLASCGMPTTSCQIAILDASNQPVSQGEVGELCIRGPLVMHGYWKLPEETAAAFSGGWMHTGDMAFEDEAGYVYLVDRKKDVIITGGFNVYPREVEDVIATHPDVAMVAVVGAPHPHWGEAVTALVVPRKGTSPDPQQIVSLVRERKGSVYAPKTVEFVEAMPLTAIGKPDKKAIRAKYWTGQSRNIG